MKSLKNAWLRIFLGTFPLLFSMAVWAQDQSEGSSSSSSSTKTTSVQVNADNSGNWYTQPWVWIVAAAVFILLLVALLNGNKGRDTVTTKRTVIRENDV